MPVEPELPAEVPGIDASKLAGDLDFSLAFACFKLSAILEGISRPLPLVRVRALGRPTPDA